LVKLLDDVKNKSKPFMTPASLVFLHLSWKSVVWQRSKLKDKVRTLSMTSNRAL
jgi:hypothetical protein